MCGVSPANGGGLANQWTLDDTLPLPFLTASSILKRCLQNNAIYWFGGNAANLGASECLLVSDLLFQVG